MNRTLNQDRTDAGMRAHRAGLAAEDSVSAHYARHGCETVARRWRAPGSGEIDLIVREGHTLVFVEIKRARNFTEAAARLSASQIGRIFCSAEAFLGNEKDGTDTETRFDVALVNADGRIEIIRNAYAA